MAVSHRPWMQALRIAAAYAVVSALWILFSDRAVEALLADPAQRTLVEIAKGWAFVAVTAVMLFAMVRGILIRNQAVVAEREQAQLRERMAFAASRDALFVFPLDESGVPGCFEAVNDEACRRLGRSQEEMLRLRPAEINSPAYRQVVCGHMKTLLRDGLVICESEHLAADGTCIPVEIAARLVASDGRHLVFSSARDLRQRRAEQSRMVDAERMAAVGLLAGGLAHEFNNLHAVAVGYLELIELHERDISRDPLVQRNAAAARSALERASALTRSLLDFARPGSGERRPERLDLIAIESLALVQRQLVADGIVVDAPCHPLPAIMMDRSQIGQVVMNLLINATHAMAGRDQRRLTIATASIPGRVCLSITDTGSGIDPANLDRIFLPFFTTKGEGGGGHQRGTGLGLSVSKALMEAHGGGIEVCSILDAGTTFTLWLPVAAAG